MGLILPLTGEYSVKIIFEVITRIVFSFLSCFSRKTFGTNGV